MMKTVLQLLDESPRGESLPSEVWLVCSPLKLGHGGVTERGRLFFVDVHGVGGTMMSTGGTPTEEVELRA